MEIDSEFCYGRPYDREEITMAMREEMETTVTGHRRDGMYYVYTADAKHLNRLDKMVAAGRAVVQKRGEDWGDFAIPASEYDPMTGFKVKRKPMTPEQKAAAAERMRNARNS